MSGAGGLAYVGRIRPEVFPRAARGEIEAALDGVGWRWSRRLSLWLDCLILLEERAA